MTLIEISRELPTRIRPQSCESDLCKAIQHMVAAGLTVPFEDICCASRGRASVAFARQTAMYLAHVVMGLNYSEIGRVFGRDRTTAAYACRAIEDRRDHPNTDALLQSLEDALRSSAAKREQVR